VYWWSGEIARLRERCSRTRRRYTRARRRRRGDEETVARVYETNREARRSLKWAIGESKKRAWDELQATLDSDPWGRPYTVVLNKLRPWTPPVTEGMDPQFLERVVDTLFPKGEEELRPLSRPRMAEDWSPELGVSEEEQAEAVGRIGARKAPGPDGIPARLWKGTAGELPPRLLRLFDRCLAWGELCPWTS
jgi:hypothetical protein